MSLREIDPNLLPNVSLKTEDNLEDFAIVVLDVYLKSSNDCQLLVHDLRRIVRESVYEFDNVDECHNFIEAHHGIKIFLIMSGTTGQSYIDQFSSMRHIELIYVFCYDRPRHISWSKYIEKIRGVFNDKNELFKMISQDVKELTNRWSFIDENSFQGVSKNEGRLFVLFVQLLIHFPEKTNSLSQMLTECRSFYKENPCMLKKIIDFSQNYTPNKAINYYSQDNFVYRIINYALRTQNIEIILRFQPYIRDLYQQLRQCLRMSILDSQRRKVEPANSQWIVYRGQYMRESELKQLTEYCRSRQSTIVLNVFGSATCKLWIALGFLQDNRPGFVPCLYEIVLPTNLFNQRQISLFHFAPFAYIAQFSNMPHEEEVLFSIGSLFRLKYIGKATSERPWIPIVLELCDEDPVFNTHGKDFGEKIGLETYEMKEVILEFIRTNINHKDLNWNRWWYQLPQKYVGRKQSDDSLAITIYECFDDPEFNRKALELRKQLLLIKDPFALIPEDQRLQSLLNLMKTKKPEKIVCLYETFFQRFHSSTPRESHNDLVIIDILQTVADAYVRLNDYNQQASLCYQQALKLSIDVGNEERINQLQKKIIQIQCPTSRKNSKLKRGTSRHLSRESTGDYSLNNELQAIYIDEYENEKEQWLEFWDFNKMARKLDSNEKFQLRLEFLWDYLRAKERWLDRYAFRSLLDLPSRKEENGFYRCSDIYPYLFLSIHNHLQNVDDDQMIFSNKQLHTWRQDKFMTDWMTLNDVRRMLLSYEDPCHFINRALPILDRLIEKLAAMITWCTLKLSLIPIANNDDVMVDINKIKWQKNRCTQVTKLVFFDERAELEILNKK